MARRRIREDTKKKKRDQLTGTQLMFTVILAVGLILAFTISSRITAGQPLEENYRQVEQEIDNLRREQATLVAERDYVRSDAYVEKWARDEGKMVLEGEVLVVPVPAGEPISTTPVPTPNPELLAEVETTPPEPENWMLWWALFFDNPPPQL